MEIQTAKENIIQKQNADVICQYLKFRLNNEMYGIDILSIKEIIDYGNITCVPMMPKFIAGVINLRGSVVPVVDLAFRFSEEASARTRKSSIVILEVKIDAEKQIEIGITVDEVNKVMDVLNSAIEPSPAFGTKIRTDFISGVAKVDEQLLMLLDIGNILKISELSAIDLLDSVSI